MPKKDKDGLWVEGRTRYPARREARAGALRLIWVGMPNGKLKVSKDEQRDALGGRSPDRADAVALAVWRVPVWTGSTKAGAATTQDYESARGPLPRR